MWSRDGRELFSFAGDAVMAAAVTAGSTFSWDPPVVLFRRPYALSGEPFARVFDVSPDGRFLMRTLSATSSGETMSAPELVAVFNWTEELAELVHVP